MKNERTYEVIVKEYSDDERLKMFGMLSKEIHQNNGLMFIRGELFQKNDWSIGYRTDKRREALDMLCFMDKVFHDKEITVEIS